MFNFNRQYNDDGFVYDRVHAILTVEELLAPADRKEAIDQVRRQSGAPADYFNALYRELIETFSYFVQNIPHLRNKRISILDRQLNIASTLLILREPYILAGDLLNRVTDHEKALWNYVMFSGMLLSRIGDLISQYDISLCDELGIRSEQWKPLLGNLSLKGEYYRIDKMRGETSTYLGYHLMLASHLMPPDGLQWIMSNPDAFEQWVMMLNGEGEHDYPSLHFYAFLSFEEWLEAYYPEEKIQPGAHPEEESEPLLDRFLFMKTQDRWDLILSNRATEIALGEQFLLWLRESISAKKIDINKKDAMLFITREGALLINPGLFNLFKADHPIHARRDVLHAFSQLPIAAQAHLQRYKTQFPGENPHHVEGLIIKEPKLLFAKEIPPQTEYVVRNQATYRVGEQALLREREQFSKTEQKRSFEVGSKASTEAKKAQEYPILLQQKAEREKVNPFASVKTRK